MQDPVVLQLRLQELLSLPLDPGSRVHLWKLALERLPGEALAQRRTLQLVLSRQAAKACESWVKAGRWTEALTCALQHGQWLAELARENPPLGEACRRDTAVLLRNLIMGLHSAQEQPNCPLLHKAELCRYGWRLVEKLRALDQPESEALQVVQEHFIRIGSPGLARAGLDPGGQRAHRSPAQRAGYGPGPDGAICPRGGTYLD